MKPAPRSLPTMLCLLASVRPAPTGREAAAPGPTRIATRGQTGAVAPFPSAPGRDLPQDRRAEDEVAR